MTKSIDLIKTYKITLFTPSGPIIYVGCSTYEVSLEGMFAKIAFLHLSSKDWIFFYNAPFLIEPEIQ